MNYKPVIESFLITPFDPQNNWVPSQPEKDPITRSQVQEDQDLEENNRTGVTEERDEMRDGEPNWSRHPQATMETSGSKEVPMETVTVTEVTLKTDNSCSP